MPASTIRHLGLALAILVATLAPEARADVFLDEDREVLLHGDVRFRLESDWSSRRSDGTEREDRDRARVRFRLGFRWDPLEHVGFGIRGRTGNTNSQQSPHVTVVQAGADGDADVLVDRAWVKFSGGRGWASVGRVGHPFWRQDELQLDDDIWLDGLTFGFRFPREHAEHRVHGAWGAVPEGEASLSWDEQGWLYGLQYVFTRELEGGEAFTVALSGIRIEDEPSRSNPVLADLDHTLWNLALQGRLRAGRVPVTLGLDVLHATDAPPKGTFNRDERDGWSLLVRFGSLEEKGDWLVGYQYARVEKFAVVPFLAQDDWLRWGSPTQTRSSNWEGHELRFGYALTKRMNLLLRVYVVEGVQLESADAVATEDGNRVRIDLNWRF